jgi:hypothetical protein
MSSPSPHAAEPTSALTTSSSATEQAAKRTVQEPLVLQRPRTPATPNGEGDHQPWGAALRSSHAAERPVEEYHLGENVVARHGSVFAAVAREAAVVSEHEVVALGHGDGPKGSPTSSWLR